MKHNLESLLYSLANCKHTVKVYSNHVNAGLLETITYNDYVSNKREITDNIELYLTCEDVYFKIEKYNIKKEKMIK